MPLLNALRRPTPRSCAVASLGLLLAYAAASGTAELFPLGGASASGFAPRGLGLLLGLALGWGVPGLSLAFLYAEKTDGPGLLGRALILGFGYLCATGAACSLLLGHAPGRTLFLVLLALPCARLASRGAPADSTADEGAALAAAALTAMVLLAAALWPPLHRAALNGDGTEVYELARSLDSHPLPRWDMESGRPGGGFGTPVVVPFWTGAFLTSGEMRVLGRGELATRLPFVSSLILVALVALGLLRKRDPAAWLYAAAATALFALWHAYYVTYEPAFPELASSGALDALTIALWLAGFRELAKGSAPLGVAAVVLASGTTYAAPVLALLALVFLLRHEPERGRAAERSAALALALVVPALVFIGWRTGDGLAWLRQIRAEYVADYVRAAGREPLGPLAGRLLLLTGFLPLAIPFAWRRLRPVDRVLALTGAAYLAVIFASSRKSLHYLAPLPWIFMAPALESASRRGRLAAAGALAVAFVLSWPNDRAVRRDAVELGRESCVRDMDYEAAVLAADSLYSEFARPPEGPVGKHTFVRYALDLGGRDCAVGLSRVGLWTDDAKRLAARRSRRTPPPSSFLFPGPAEAR